MTEFHTNDWGVERFYQNIRRKMLGRGCIHFPINSAENNFLKTFASYRTGRFILTFLCSFEGTTRYEFLQYVHFRKNGYVSRMIDLFHFQKVPHNTRKDTRYTRICNACSSIHNQHNLIPRNKVFLNKVDLFQFNLCLAV